MAKVGNISEKPVAEELRIVRPRLTTGFEIRVLNLIQCVLTTRKKSFCLTRLYTSFQGLKEYTTFNDGMSKLSTFLRNIPDWDISSGGADLLDPAVFVHIRQLHKNVLADRWTGNRVEVIGKLFALAEQYRTDENIDLFAAGVLEAIQLERQYESSEFPVHFLPWLMNFRQYFRRSQLQKYWPIVMQNLLKQTGDRMAGSDRSRLDFTLPADCQFVYDRCHVQ